jgi:hypothetical protein
MKGACTCQMVSSWTEPGKLKCLGVDHLECYPTRYFDDYLEFATVAHLKEMCRRSWTVDSILHYKLWSFYDRLNFKLPSDSTLHKMQGGCSGLFKLIRICPVMYKFGIILFFLVWIISYTHEHWMDISVRSCDVTTSDNGSIVPLFS